METCTPSSAIVSFFSSSSSSLSSWESNPKLFLSQFPSQPKAFCHIQARKTVHEEPCPLHKPFQEMKKKAKTKMKVQGKMAVMIEYNRDQSVCEGNANHVTFRETMSPSPERSQITTHTPHNSRKSKGVINEGNETRKRKRKNQDEFFDNDDAKHEPLGKALSSLESGLWPEPSVDGYIHMMHRCRKEKGVSNTNRLYAYMRLKGADTHASLGNYLVPLLVEAGLIDEAHQVFDNMDCKNEFSWTCLISAYVREGKPTQALKLYHDMLQYGTVLPNGYTIVAVLKACTSLKDLKRGALVHAHLLGTSWLEKDLFVGNTLIDMYAKCGSLYKAREVFDTLLRRDVISWNALITGYIEQGKANCALECFKKMQMEKVIYPNAVTIICCLKACGNIANIVMGRELHMHVVKKGLETDLSVSRTIVDMYAKCSSLVESRQVLDKLPIRDVVSYTALIGGYTNHGQNEEALKGYESMRSQGIFPDAITLVHCSRACGNMGSTEKGFEIHAEIARRGLLETNVVIGNALIDMYVKCNCLTKAQEVFDKIPVRDVVSWTSLIAGYGGVGDGEFAIHLFEKMMIEGVSPNPITYVSVLSACGSIGALVKGQEIHNEVERQGLLDNDLFVGNAIVDMYAKCGLLEAAQEVFNKLPYRDLVSWTSLLAGHLEYGCSEKVFDCYKRMHLERISPDAVITLYILKACASTKDVIKGRQIHLEITCKGFLERNAAIGIALIDMYGKCGFFWEAEQVFDNLLLQDTVAWNALLTAYVEHKRCEDVFDCLELMQIHGIVQDSITFVCGLKACGTLGAAQLGQEIHQVIGKGKFLEQDSVMCNALLDMYIKCGLLGNARELFENLCFQDVVTYTAIITGYSQLGESPIVFYFFNRMIIEGILPNSVTFISVLGACCHGGLVKKGEILFQAMCDTYRINPSPQHLTCMVDLLGRAGQLEKAIELIKNMFFLVDDSVWHSVLAACRRSGNLAVGRQAFQYALGLDEQDVTAFISLSNLYADGGVGDIDEVEIVNNVRK